MKKKAESKGQPDCTWCGGLHYGSTPGECPFQCKKCGKDIRPDGECKCPKADPYAPNPRARKPVVTDEDIRERKDEYVRALKHETQASLSVREAWKQRVEMFDELLRRRESDRRRAL